MSRSLRAAGLIFLVSSGLVGCGEDSPTQPRKQSEDVVDEPQTVPELGPRIDRIGRPEVTNFMVRVPALKVEYNGDDSFDVPDGQRAKYLAAISSAIAHYDSLDGTVDHDPAAVAALAAVLVEDHLRIDLSRSCDLTGEGHFAIERAELHGGEQASCGGRSLDEDVFDQLLTIYTSGFRADAPRAGDGVDREHSTGLSSDTFPYLAEPHLTTLRP
jgi:hypothetical protein